MSSGDRQLDVAERAQRLEIGGLEDPGRLQVAGVQRARILSAMSVVCVERGVANVTVADIVERAGVSRRTFYELFDDCESCLLQTLEAAASRITERVVAAYDPEAPWRERIRTSLGALLAFLDEEPAIGRMLIVESHAAGADAEAIRSRLLAHVIAAVDAGRAVGKRDLGLPPTTAEGTVGAVLFVIHRRMTTGGTQPLVALVNQLMSMIVLPYLGAAAARAELKHAVDAPKRPPKPRRDSLADLDIRLTYRTMRVLAAIGARPGSSNREIGRAAGAADPGQISKLLTRLQRLGLIENSESGGVRGAPNAWKLTQKGAEVERAIAAHSGP